MVAATERVTVGLVRALVVYPWGEPTGASTELDAAHLATRLRRAVAVLQRIQQER